MCAGIWQPRTCWQSTEVWIERNHDQNDHECGSCGEDGTHARTFMEEKKNHSRELVTGEVSQTRSVLFSEGFKPGTGFDMGDAQGDCSFVLMI